MTIYWRIPVSVRLRAPWVTPGDRAPGPSTDIVLARDREGNFILPATLIKGNLKAAADRLVVDGNLSTDDRDKAFGTQSGSRTTGTPVHPWTVVNEPERAALIFDDLILQTDVPEDGGNKRTQRVEIDPDLGAAKEGHLLFVECPFAFGTEVTFTGDVILTRASVPGTTSLDPSSATRLLKPAFERLFAIGGMKSVGFGRVLHYDVETPISVTHARARNPARDLALSYSVDRPFVIDVTRHSGNLAIGSDVIPGAAIKAVLAEGFKAAGVSDATDFISELSISHAMPNGRRVLPLSLSIAGDRLFDNLDGQIKAGHHRFQGDWKGNEAEKVRRTLGAGWATPKIRKSGRTRTAIDSTNMTARYEDGAGMLFSQVAIVPDGGLIWQGTIRAPDDPDKLAVAVGLLQAGLPGLGKTGAVLQATQIGPADAVTVPRGAALNLTLTTPACLFKPDTVGGATAQQLYTDYFAPLGLELETFFARQELKGGYLALRYRAVAGKYIPWVLTSAGSVFRLEITDRARVADILTNGLPPAVGLSTDWRELPFLRENGFGHVTNGILDHAALADGKEIAR